MFKQHSNSLGDPFTLSFPQNKNCGLTGDSILSKANSLKMPSKKNPLFYVNESKLSSSDKLKNYNLQNRNNSVFKPKERKMKNFEEFRKKNDAQYDFLNLRPSSFLINNEGRMRSTSYKKNIYPRNHFGLDQENNNVLITNQIRKQNPEPKNEYFGEFKQRSFQPKSYQQQER